MGFLTELEQVVLAAAAERLIPAEAGHPGATALGVADYIDGLLGAFGVDPPRIWAGGPFSGRVRRRGAFRPVPPTLDRSKRWPGEPASRGRRAFPSASERADPGVANAVPRAASPRSVRTSPGSTRTSRITVSTADAEFRQLLYEHVVEGAYAAPEYGGNRDLAGWAAIGFPGDVQPRGYIDADVAGPRMTVEWDAVIVGTGPAGATAADVLTARGLVRDDAREGPEPPAGARGAVRAAGTRLERRAQVHAAPLPRP